MMASEFLACVAPQVSGSFMMAAFAELARVIAKIAVKAVFAVFINYPLLI
jgi:hypothetical protein